jgi:prevent-host-death family protein
MEKVTTHEAKTHLSQLLSRVLRGEEVVICRGAQPIARLVPAEAGGMLPRRPAVGTITSGPVTCSEDCFAPLTDDALLDWGL